MKNTAEVSKGAILWQWTKDQGYSIKELAEKLGYTSPRYVEQVVRGWEKMSPAFVGRFILAFPEYAHIFTDAPGSES